MENGNTQKEEGIISPIQLGDLQKPDGSRASVADTTFNQILNQTGGEACIVISLAKRVDGSANPAPIHGFHISAVNVDLGFMPGILKLIAEALLGRLGGTTVIKNVVEVKDYPKT